MISTDEEFESDELEDPLLFLGDIEKGKISLEEAKNLQQDYGNYLKYIQKGNKNEKP